MFQSFDDVEQYLYEFRLKFPNFPNVDWLRLRTVLLFGKKLASYLLPLDEDDIDVTLFSLRALNEPIECTFFAFSNISYHANSVVFLSLADDSKLKQELKRQNVAPELLYQVLASIERYPSLQSSQYALVKKTIPEQSDAAVASFVKLHIICEGHPVHRSYHHTKSPVIIDREVINIENEYQQLNEVIYVLSEYNSRTELLAKYLTIYHAIENFMFKLPIVDMEIRNSGRMFSIRDFRRLYDEIDRNEPDALRKLITRVFQESVTSGATLGAHILQRWTTLQTNISPADLVRIMTQMNIKGNNGMLTYGDLTPNNVASRFSEMVYAFRNAIVHNKETEFHLTYANLEPNIRPFIENFMIPALEEVTFCVVSSRNNIAWYSRQHLLLYQS